jgi:hypothetical protein
MIYEKPEIAVLGDASSLICGSKSINGDGGLGAPVDREYDD